MHHGTSRIAQQARGLFSLTRPLNMLIAIIGTIAAALIADVAQGTWVPVLLAAATAAFIGAAGNVINDVFDVSIDRINKPQRAIAAGIVHPRVAALTAAIAAALGILTAAAVGTFALALALVSLLLLYLYSAAFKRMPLIGNITVGLITGAVFILGAAAAGDVSAGIIPALFACVFNIGREILKDIEDMHGDRESGVRTFPLDHGVEPALHLSAIIFGLVILASPLPWLLAGYSVWYLLLVLFCVDSVILYCMLRAYRHPTTQTLRHINGILKIAMILGIVAIVVGTVT